MDLFSFLALLEERHVAYTLGRSRDDTVLVTAVVPGQRWEVECFSDGHVEVECFESDGGILDLEVALPRIVDRAT